MYKCKSFVNNEKSAKPLKGLLKGAPIKLILLAMVMIVAGAMLLGVATAVDGNTVITGSVIDKIKITQPTGISGWNIDPDKDVVGINSETSNTQTGTVTVKSNSHLHGWQVAVTDGKTSHKGHLVKDSTALTNSLHVIKTDTPTTDINLDGTNSAILATGTRTTGTGTDIGVTFSQAGSYSDALDTGYTITVTFTASNSVPSPPPASPFL